MAMQFYDVQPDYVCTPMNILDTPQGQFTLNRYPLRKDEQLRAWDAADEYLLLHLAELGLPSKSSKTLILNDAFGALSIALADSHPITVTDSYISEQAIGANSKINDTDPDKISLQNSLQPLIEIYDLIIIKVPKNLAMLEHQLFKIRDCCNENTLILAAAMSKYIHTSTLKIFDRIIGPTTTSLARKKARLVISKLDKSLNPGEAPFPDQYTLETTGDTYLNHANVFSREKLDLGSRFMLEYIAQSNNYKNILDLACGNGVLGIAAARINPQSNVCFVDESYMAVESARINAQNIIQDNKRLSFTVTDCLQGIEKDSLDLILNNPPFHQNHAVGDFIAWQMFSEAREKLKAGGELLIVGNRHLGYHIKLKRLFGNCETVASNKKFVILKAIKH